MKPQTKFSVDAYMHWLIARAEAKVAQLMYDRNLAEVESEEVRDFVQFTNRMLKTYEEWEKKASEKNLQELVSALKEIREEKDAA